MKKIGKIDYRGEELILYQTAYVENPFQKALLLKTAKGEPFAKLTVNPDLNTHIPEDYFIIKDWSENEIIIDYLEKSEILTRTNFTTIAGARDARIYRLNRDKLS